MIMEHVDVQYLVYNFEIDAYYFMKESTLNKCQMWQSNKRVCEGCWPWSIASDGSCELKPLKLNRASNCIHKSIVESKSYWIELERKSSWLLRLRIIHKLDRNSRFAGTRDFSNKVGLHCSS